MKATCKPTTAVHSLDCRRRHAGGSSSGSFFERRAEHCCLLLLLLLLLTTMKAAVLFYHLGGLGVDEIRIEKVSRSLVNLEKKQYFFDFYGKVGVKTFK